MNILVLNGSPRPKGNTVKMVAAFRESAEKAGHIVNIVNVCRKNIKGCLACEYCHGKGQGQCVQKDDMQEVYAAMGTVLLCLSPCTHHAVWRGTVRRPSGKTWKGCADELIKRDIQASAVTQLSYTENEHDRRNIQLCKKEIRS